MKNVIILIFTLFIVISCKESNNNDSKSSDINEKTHEMKDEINLKVYIDQNGSLFIDGVKSDLKTLDESLSVLKESNGTVYYSRSQTYQGDKTIEVVDLIASHQLPIAFYTNRTFTERVQL